MSLSVQGRIFNQRVDTYDSRSGQAWPRQLLLLDSGNHVLGNLARYVCNMCATLDHWNWIGKRNLSLRYKTEIGAMWTTEEENTLHQTYLTLPKSQDQFRLNILFRIFSSSPGCLYCLQVLFQMWCGWLGLHHRQQEYYLEPDAGQYLSNFTFTMSNRWVTFPGVFGSRLHHGHWPSPRPQKKLCSFQGTWWTPEHEMWGSRPNHRRNDYLSPSPKKFIVVSNRRRGTYIWSGLQLLTSQPSPFGRTAELAKRMLQHDVVNVECFPMLFWHNLAYNTVHVLKSCLALR